MADKAFSAEQVAQHRSEADCWVRGARVLPRRALTRRWRRRQIIIHGQVYNVTKFLDDHPGGPDIIADGAGTDLTDQFEDTGHSAEAREGALRNAPEANAWRQT